MQRKKHTLSQRSKQPRKKLLLETCEDRILCSATTPTNDAPETPPAPDPTATTVLVASTPEAPPLPSSTSVAAGATAAQRAEIAATPPAAASTTQLTDQQRTDVAAAVRESTNQIWFQKNVGQFAEGVRYGFTTAFGSMLVYDDHLQLIANQTDPATGQVGLHAVDIAFNGANADWQFVPGELSGITGSYQQADGSVLKPDLFKELTIRNVYNGVDLRLYSAENATLEFDWIVAHAQDYQKIAINFTGQDGLSFGADGSATLDLRFQDLTLKMPEVYQVINGEKIAVGAAMVQGATPGEMKYSLSGNIVADQPLVIDPNVVWATYFDLNDSTLPFDSYLFAINVNANGTYATGWVRETITNALYGPVGTTNTYMQVNAGFAEGTAINQIYIYRLSNDGLNITAWTSTGLANNNGTVVNQKLNSAGVDTPADLELFPDGRVLLGLNSGVIQIYSANLAARSFNAEPVSMDSLNSVAIVDNDRFYVGGRVVAAIPVLELAAANIGPDATFAGGPLGLEGVIVRYTNASTAPTAAWATYVGGNSDEYFTGVAMTPDMSKLVFATTTTIGAAYPAMVNAVDSTPGAAGTTEILTGVIADSDTKPAAFSVFSFLGGSSNEGTLGGTDTVAALVTATNTFYWVGGNTTSVDLPGTAGGAQAANGGGMDAFASRISVSGGAAGFQSTYMGGAGTDIMGGIAYDIFADRLLLFGTTTGSFPVLNTVPASNYFDNTFGGGTYDIFVATVNGVLTTQDFGTYVGGSTNDYLGQTGELVGQGHVLYSPITGLSYLATTVHSTDIPANIIGTPPGKDTTKSNVGNDSHIIFAFNINIFDYGDTPISYDGGSAATAAKEALSSTIRIGTTVDAEATPQSSANALGDDLFSSDDEDGIASAATLAFGQASYSTTVSVFNNSGVARTLQGWIDFNRDGAFQVGEFASVSVPNNVAQQNVTLTWASIPALTAGQSYLRLRLSDNALVDNAGTAAVDERSIGAGGSGEVEDHSLIISQSSLAGTVYRDLNNNGAINGGETGIDGVTVTLTGTNDLGVAVNTSVVTAGGGLYSFANIRPSNGAGYTITETQPAGFLDGLNTLGTAGGVAGNPPPGDAITGVVIGTNVAATGYLFGELPPSTLSGTVYRDLNNDGLINGTDTTINGVTVTLTGTDDLGAAVNLSTATAGAGAYSFTNLRPGTYTITETQPAGLLDGKETVGTQASGTINNGIDNNTIATITLASNTTGSANNFGELPPASFAAVVYRDLNNDAVQLGAGETGIQNATVTLTGTDDRGGVVNTFLLTDATGNVLFSNLRPGTYTITETQPAGFLDGLDSNGVPVGTLANDVVSAIALTAGTAGAGYKFGELPPSSISGTVYRDLNNDAAQLGAGETGIQTVTVVLTGTDDLGNAVNVSTTTDALGNYTFANLRPSNATGYTITETQPAGFLDGKNTTGTAGGAAGNPPPGDAITGVVIASNTTATGYLFGELPPSTLSGTVYRDLNNDGLINGADTTINGVTLTLTGTDDLGAVVNLSTATAGAGAYSFTNLRPGTYTITETQPAGLLDGKETVGTQASGTINNGIDNNTIATITLASNTTGSGNNFGELPPASFAAVVYRDLNNDGTQLGAGETGIQNATVTLTGTDDRGVAVNTPLLTDATGTVNFTNLRPGTYTITETQPVGFLDGLDSNGVPAGTLANDVVSNITLTVGTAGTGYKFGELPTTSLSGTVYRDLNNDGTQLGAGETGIQTVTVTLTGTNDLGAAVNVSTTTDALGNYIFNGLRPSNGAGYTVTETQPAGFLDGLNTAGTSGGAAGNPPPGDAITGVVLTAGTAATGYNFGELPPSSLAGTVYRDNNNSGAIDAGELGIDGVTVTLTGTNDLGVVVNVSAVTAGGGLYSFTNLRPSNGAGYTISETQPAAFLDGKDTAGTAGGSAAAIPGDAISTIVLASNTTGTTYIFGELNPASLSGFVYADTSNLGVKDAFESGIPGATVTLTGTNDLGAIVPIVATTSATGAYTFTNLRPGTYAITETQPSGYADGADTLGTGLSAPNNAGSAAISDIFSGVVFSTVLAGNNTGVNYNFGESPNFGLTKTLQTTNVAATVDPSVTLGEIATFRLVATIPAGSFTNFQLQDALPAGYVFINGTAFASLVSSAGQLTSSTLAGAGLAQTTVGTPTFVLPDAAVSDNTASNSDAYVSGTDVFFKIGNLTNVDTNGGTTESVVIEFQAQVVNEVANQGGVTLDNTFSVLFDKDGNGTPDPHGPPSNTITSTVAEPNVTISKTANPVSLVDAGDVITYTVTLTNPGGANSSTAFDTLLVDTMPANLLVTGITSTTLNGGATSDSAAAIGGGGTSITGQYDIPAGGSVVVVYTATVQIGFAPNGTLTNSAVLTWTSLNGGNSTAPDANERFGAAGSTFGDGSINDYRRITSATTTGAGPTFSKVLFSTSDAGTAGSNVGIGETVTFGLLVTLPEGTTSGFNVLDALPAGLQFVSSSIVTSAAASNGFLTANFNGAVPAPTVTQPGGNVNFAFGAITTTGDNVATNNTFLVLVNTVVTDIAGNSGLSGAQTTLSNSATFSGTGIPPTNPPPVVTTVIEPRLQIVKGVDDPSADLGQVLNYTLTISHTASSTETAYDLILRDAIPAGLTLNIASIAIAGGVIATNTSTASQLALTIDQFAVGGTITITYSATVGTGAALVGTNQDNNARMFWDSLADDAGSNAVFTNVADGTADRDFGATFGYVELPTPGVDDLAQDSARVTINGNTISGTVYADADASGTLNGAETGINNVALTLSGTTFFGIAYTQNATTNAAGAYSFTNVPRGTYTITETQPAGFIDGLETVGTNFGGVVSSVLNVDTITGLVAPVGVNTGTGYNFGELLTSSLAGTTYRDFNNDGLINGTDTTINGVTVALTGTDVFGQAVNTTVSTAGAGAYAFAGLRPSNGAGYTITETQPAGLLDGKETVGTQASGTINNAIDNNTIATITLAQNVSGTGNNFGELPTASLAGFVYTDANNDGTKQGGESGIFGATVTLTGTDDRGAIAPIATTTLADGSYNFGSLRPGTYAITETQPGTHLDGKDTIGTPGGTTANDVFSNVVLTAGVNGADNNFGELRAASLAGFVYADVNNDGIKQGGESGIFGVTVTLTGADDFGAIAPIVTTTLLDGSYSFGTLRPGTYVITETQPGTHFDGTDTIGTPGGTTGNDVFSNVVLAEGVNGTNNNFGELLAATITGNVYSDLNNDGIQLGAGETGIGGVTVTLTGTNDLGVIAPIVTTTLADGSYSFGALRPGTYTVTETQPLGYLDGRDTAGSPGGGTAGNDVISTITVGSGITSANNNFGELNPASLSGNVYADLDGDGVFDGFESGIRGATVTLTGTNDLGAIAPIVLTTDANGAYSFTNLRTGTYAINETQPADYTDGADTLGTGLTAPNSAGTAGNDVMSGITITTVAPGNNTGVNYNFGEQPNFSLSKTLVNTSEAGTLGSSVAIGEVATFRLVVTIPVGSLTNFQVQDFLPAGYAYVDGSARAGLVGALTSSTVTAPLAGIGSTPTFVLADASVSDNALTDNDGYVSGTDVFFKFGNLTNTDATAAVEAVVIEFNAVVVNEAANVAGTSLTNSFGILYERNGLPNPDPDPNPNPPPPVTTTVVTPRLTLTKTASPTSGLEAGNNVTYTLTLTNPGGANASTAFDAHILDVLPADIRATAINSVVLNGGATTDNALAITGGGTGLNGQFDIPVGGSVVITYTAAVQVSVNPGASETNNAELTWTSINGGNSSAPDAGERYGAPGTIFGDANLNNLRVTDSKTVTVASGTFSKVLFGTSDPSTLGNNVAVGETVIYGLVITLPAGTTQTLNATDALPAGLQFVSSQIVTSAAASNGFLTANFNGTVPAPGVSGGVSDGDDVAFTFNNIVANADGVSGNNTFLLLVSARVTNVLGNSGSPQTLLPNVATFDDPNDPKPPFTPPPVTVNVIEPVLTIAKDFNVPQADAGDTVQISIVVNNTGNGPAYDVALTDAVNLSKFGSITAVTTPAGFTFNNAAGTVSYTGGTIAAGSSATFVFSVKLTNAVNPSEVLSNTATATATSQPGVVVGERTFGPISDGATLNVPAVFTLTKGITSPTGGTVKIGDLVTYSVNVTLLEGTTNNITLTDILPAGMTYLNGSAVVSNANGMTVNGFTASAVGNTLSIGATSVVNPGSVDNTATTDSHTFTITYQTTVNDVAGNTAGTLLTNSLTGGGTGVPPSNPPPVTTTVTEPQLQISKLVDDATANIGQTLHFTLTIQNLNVANGATAYDLLVRDALPAGLAGLANIVVTGASVDANTSTATLLDLKLTQLALGATATITFDATVDVNVALVGTNIDNNARLYWDSQPAESANSVLTGTPDGDGDRDYGAGPGVEVFNANTDPAQDTERLTVNANTISGTVYQDVNANGAFNAGDTGLNGQTVMLSGNLAAGGASFTVTTTTDINGNYTFNNVPAGTYVITETQPAGYVDGAETAGSPFGGTVSAALGSNTISSIVVPGGSSAGTGYNFGEVLTSTFAGSVYEDVNNDGARVGEPGISGVTVTLTGTDFLGQSVTFTTTTNGTGDFNFDGGASGVRPGTYTITETTQPAGYLDGKDTSGTPAGTVTNDVFSTITIAHNTTASGYLFGELLPATLSGNVYHDANNDGIFAGETGIGSVFVTLTGTNDLGAIAPVTVQTLGDGSYSFGNLRPGIYTVTEAQPASFLDGTDTAGSIGGGIALNGATDSDQINTITLTSGLVSAGNNFGEVRANSLTGQVYLDLDNDGLNEVGEPKISGVTITLTGTDARGNAVNIPTTTDGLGIYNFTGLRPGTYIITETQPAFYNDGIDTLGTVGGLPVGSVGADQFTGVTLISGQSGIAYNFGERGTTITGTVFRDVDKAGDLDAGTDTGIGGVTLTLRDSGSNIVGTTVTLANGSYVFDNVIAGSYTVTETQPVGYGSSTPNVLNVTAVLAGTTGADFGETLGSLSGRVFRDDNGDGIVNGADVGIVTNVTLTGLNALGQNINTTIATNPDGTYVFNDLLSGAYVITETQPAGLNDGPDYVGTLGGVGVVNDQFSAVPIPAGFDGLNYNFTERFPFDPVKTLVSTSNPGTSGANVTIGETVRYRLVIALPEGTLNDYVIADSLPAGMRFLDDGTASVGFVSNTGALITSSTLGTAPGITASTDPLTFGLAPSAISNSANADTNGWGSGTDVFFRLGNITNSDDDTGREYVIIEFNAQVLNEPANQSGRVLSNTFTARYDTNGDKVNDPLPPNVVSPPVRTPVVEPILSLDKQITAGPVQPKPGDTLTFTVTIGHAAGSGATAWETVFTDTLPAGLQFVSVSTQASGGAVVTKAATFDGTGHVSGLFDIPVGGHVTITYQVKVATNVKSGATLVNGADIQWSSAPGDDPHERKSGDSLLNKGGLNDYELKAQAQLTVSNPPKMFYFYDGFNKWHRKGLDRDLATIYSVESPDNYRPPILPLAPIYSGEADPGSTLTLTLTNANGETIGTQTVVVDAGGNWMATFPTTTIRDFPNSVRIEQTNAFYSLTDSPGHNLRAYYSPALSPGHFFFEELRTIAQDTESPLLSGLAIENPLGVGTTKYGGELLSTQGVAGGY